MHNMNDIRIKHCYSKTNETIRYAQWNTLILTQIEQIFADQILK